MPTYEYKCNACNDSWEAFYKIDERDAPKHTPCPKCGAEVGSVTQKVGMGLVKPPDGFNEVLRNISDVSPNNSMKIRD